MKSLYMVAGNHVDVPDMVPLRSSSFEWRTTYFRDQRCPRGQCEHSEWPPGGWVSQIFPDGILLCVDLRVIEIPFDIAFMSRRFISYDSDMGGTFGMPWYRPTRICHVTSDQNIGWRTGNKNGHLFIQITPATIISVRVPTNVNVWQPELIFPEKYQKALYASIGVLELFMPSILKPNGANLWSYCRRIYFWFATFHDRWNHRPDGAM